MDGYKEAHKIEEQINRLLTKNRITKSNSLEWLRFTRTIETGLSTISEAANIQLRPNIPKAFKELADAVGPDFNSKATRR